MPSPVATVVASAARTATGTTGTLDAPSEANLILAVVCSAVSGTTPTMTLSIEWSMDGTNWCPAATADAFAEMTAASNVVKPFTVKGSSYRIKWTIGGTTPSFTFTVTELGID